MFAKLSNAVRLMAERIPGDLVAMRQLLGDPGFSTSYYPAGQHKSRLSVTADLLRWWLRHREVNRYFYFYGLDRKHGVDESDFLPYNEFRRIRNRRNEQGNGSGYSYRCLVRDKFVFGQFAHSIGIPTPANLALCTRDSVTWLDGRGEMPWETVLADNSLQLDTFCKKLSGIGGEGVFPLRISAGTIWLDDQPTSLEQLRVQLKGMYLLQQPIQQHAELSRLHAPSINAIRLITFNNHGKVQPFWAALKIGAGGSRMDNVARGGLAVRIDLDSGRLQGDGMFLPGRGTTIAHHPDTGVRLDGFQIPFFTEAVKAAVDLHRTLYGIHSIGWDIGITPTGPTIIEGNDDWAGHFVMAFMPKFRSRFMAMYSGVRGNR